MSLKEQAGELLANPKLGIGMAAATTTSGVGTWFNYIPDDIGKLAALVGGVLSLVLIGVHSLTIREKLFDMEVKRRLEEERRRGLERRLD